MNEEETNKISDLVVKFIECMRIDIRLEIVYIITFVLTDEQQDKIKDFMKVREYCKKKLLDESFLRDLRKRLSVTESHDAVKYFDKILDKFDDVWNYNRELEKKILSINIYLLEFMAKLLRELEVQSLEFKL